MQPFVSAVTAIANYVAEGPQLGSPVKGLVYHCGGENVPEYFDLIRTSPRPVYL